MDPEWREVNGTNVLTIYGRKMDRVYSAGDLGDSVLGQRLVFIDLDAVDGEVNKIMETLRGKSPYFLFKGKRRVDATKLVKRIFAGMNKNDIREQFLHGTRAHEFFHQAQDMLQLPYKGTDYFGFSANIWKERVAPQERESLDRETGAMLAQIISAKDPGLELFDIFKFALSGQNNAYYFGALWIMNRLDGRPVDQWTDGQNFDELIRQFEHIYEMGPVGIKNRAQKLMEDNWSKELLKAVEGADAAMFSTQRIAEYKRAYNRFVKNKNPTLSFMDFVLDRLVRESLGNIKVDKVIYGASGADITNVLLSTQAKTVYMVSADQNSIDYLKKYIEDDWDSVDGLKQQRTYAALKYSQGWQYFFVSASLIWASGVVAELKTLGLKREDLTFETAEDGRPSLTFNLDLGNGIKEKKKHYLYPCQFA